MKRSSRNEAALFACLLLGLYLVARGNGSSAVRAAKYLSRLWPPEISALPDIAPAVFETLKMSFLGTVLAAATALPLSYFGCRILTGNLALYAAMRVFLSVLRATPALVLGIMFVAALGLGPTAGVMGIWFQTTGALGKYLSETLEASDRSVREAAAIDGATGWQMFWHVLLPLQAHTYASFILYYVESNFRSAVILGIVGAGGIGLELKASVGLFKYNRTGLIVLVIIGLALALDFMSRWIRRRFLE